MKPAYEHDCDKCRFVGQRSSLRGEPKTNVVDLYICNIEYHRARGTMDQVSLVHRYSSEPSNYGSWALGYADQNDRTTETIRLAREQGLI